MLRADQDLAATRLASHADTVIDRERQRRRIIAAIGTVEIGVTAPQRRAVAELEALAELPAAQSEEVTMSAAAQPAPENLPAPLPANAVTPAGPRALEPAAHGGGLELPIIGTVPFTGTAARWIRPLVPSFVADALDTATHPLRTVRHVLEETEEITFTLRRTRKVTMDSTEPTGDFGAGPDALTSHQNPSELEYPGRHQHPPAPDRHQNHLHRAARLRTSAGRRAAVDRHRLPPHVSYTRTWGRSGPVPHRPGSDFATVKTSRAYCG
jgi:hypothetical protein